jgi:hypothetical protein
MRKKMKKFEGDLLVVFIRIRKVENFQARWIMENYWRERYNFEQDKGRSCCDAIRIAYCAVRSVHCAVKVRAKCGRSTLVADKAT